MASNGSDASAVRSSNGTGAIVAPPPGIGGGDDFHHDIARDIGQQVEAMILEAKHASETKVGKEIQKIKQKMEAMVEKIKMINDKVATVEPDRNALLKTDLQSSIAKLEEVWEGEVSTLKHELWQTIQAHNHNADLLKHHKDAIDQVQNRMTDAAPNPELEQVHLQLLQVDKVLQREMAREAQADQLVARVAQVQQQMFSYPGATNAAAAYLAARGGAVPGFPGVGVAVPKKTQKKAAKAKAGTAKAKASAAALSAASLRAEAPEFVPAWGPDG